MSMWWWSVAVSPGCGRPSTWPRPTPPSASPFSSGTSSVSVPRVGTADGAPHCSRPPTARLDSTVGPGSGDAMRRAMQATVDEVGRVVATEGIACGFVRGGTVVLARTGVQLRRARDEVAAARARGVDEHDLRLLSAAEASARVGATGILGGPTPLTAPPSIRHGWFGSVRGGRATGGRHLRADRGLCDPARRGRDEPGIVRAASVVRATEGYTRTLEGEERDPGPRVLADDRHRAPPRRVLGRGRSGQPGDLQRPPPSDHLRPADRGRPAGLRWARCSIPLRLGHPARIRPGRTGPRGTSPDTLRAVPGLVRIRDHPPLGRPTRNRPRLVPLSRARSPRPASPGPAATSATGCRPPIWPGGHCAISSSAVTPTWSPCPGWGTDRRPGSPSPCASSGSTPGSDWPEVPTGPKTAPVAPLGAPEPSSGCSAPDRRRFWPRWPRSACEGVPG